MLEYRFDKLTGVWVVISTERGKRPYDFEKTYIRKSKGNLCPFCMGNEDLTPKETLRSPDIKQWHIRIVENKYPAVKPEIPLSDEADFYRRVSGFGHHEVIIDTPDHHKGLADKTPEEMDALIDAILRRVAQMEADPRVRYVQVFKNSGLEAGATIAHSHWQIMALPVVPSKQVQTHGLFTAHEKQTGHCLLCDIIAFEQQQKCRVLLENEHFIVIAPYASRFFYETHIYPKRHTAMLQDCDEAEKRAFSQIFLQAIKKLERLFPALCYNICLNQRAKLTEAGCFHWYLEIIPRLGSLAGFELGTGSYSNHVNPEEAAQRLREI